MSPILSCASLAPLLDVVQEHSPVNLQQHKSPFLSLFPGSENEDTTPCQSWEKVKRSKQRLPLTPLIVSEGFSPISHTILSLSMTSFKNVVTYPICRGYMPRPPGILKLDSAKPYVSLHSVCSARQLLSEWQVSNMYSVDTWDKNDMSCSGQEGTRFPNCAGFAI